MVIKNDPDEKPGVKVQPITTGCRFINPLMNICLCMYILLYQAKSDTRPLQYSICTS